MSQKKVCRVHGHVLAQCRCPCSERKIEMDCTPDCPDYEQFNQQPEITESSQILDNEPS